MLIKVKIEIKSKSVIGFQQTQLNKAFWHISSYIKHIFID